MGTLLSKRLFPLETAHEALALHRAEGADLTTGGETVRSELGDDIYYIQVFPDRFRETNDLDLLRGLILYCGGNSDTLPVYAEGLQRIANSTDRVVVAFEYPGYNRSSGNPSVAAINSAAMAVAARVCSLYYDRVGGRVLPVVVWGFSIGSCAAMHVAENVPVAGLVLVAPLTTGAIYALHGLFNIQTDIDFLGSADVFNNLQVARRSGSRFGNVLIVHGKNDVVIDPLHSQILLAALKDSVRTDLFVVEGADHCEVDPVKVIEFDKTRDVSIFA